MIIGMGAGIIFSALDVHLPAFATTAIGLVASAASPVALFVIGGSLVGLHSTVSAPTSPPSSSEN